MVTALARHRRPAGRDRRQPAALPRRRARRRGLGEGGALRRLLQLVRPAADRGRRHARASCPGSKQEQAGVIRHGASAGARVRGCDGAEADRRAAQVLRRRLHHDELARPRRRPGARLARRRARDHERAGGGRDRQPPRAARWPTTPTPSATVSPTPTPTSTCEPRRAAAEGFVDEIIEPAQTRDRLAAALEAFAAGGRA